jgi:hypothetical protein
MVFQYYMMRNGVVQLLGYLVRKAFTETEDGVTAPNDGTRDSLLNILEERFHDVNSYTRTKVVQTWLYLYQ